MSAISPCLWFDDNLEEAMEFYTKIFPDSSIGAVSRYGEAGPGEPGTVMAGEWTIERHAFRGINGGPVHARFTEAISLSVSCADQAEVDYYWDNLVAGGEARPVRLAQGPVRAVLADRARPARRAALRPGPRSRAEAASGHAAACRRSSSPTWRPPPTPCPPPGAAAPWSEAGHSAGRRPRALA